MKETQELFEAREKRDRCRDGLGGDAIVLSLWFLGFLFSALWLYPRVPDSLWPLRMLSLVTAIGLFLSLVFTYEDFSGWKSAKRLVESIEAIPLRQKELAREYKEAKGGQD